MQKSNKGPYLIEKQTNEHTAIDNLFFLKSGK